MPKSDALIEFEESVSMAEALLLLEQTYNDPPPPTDMKIVQGLRGGIAVLLVAAFENFLKEVIVEGVDRIAIHSPPVIYAKLPVKLRENHHYLTLERAMKGPPYQEHVERIQRLPDIQSACALIVNSQIRANVFSDTGGNPNDKTVTAMFAKIGLDNLLVKIKVDFDANWGQQRQTFLSGISSKRLLAAGTQLLTQPLRSTLPVQTWVRQFAF